MKSRRKGEGGGRGIGILGRKIVLLCRCFIILKSISISNFILNTHQLGCDNKERERESGFTIGLGEFSWNSVCNIDFFLWLCYIVVALALYWVSAREEYISNIQRWPANRILLHPPGAPSLRITTYLSILSKPTFPFPLLFPLLLPPSFFLLLVLFFNLFIHETSLPR